MIHSALLILLGLFLVSCTRAPSNEIHFGIAQAPINFDPRYASDATSERINRLIYCAPVDFDAHSKPKSWLTSWTVRSPTSYVFRLTGDCPQFHHGKSLTVDDVIATYQSILEDTKSPHHQEFANIASIQKVDAHSFIIALHQADAFFPAKLVIGVLPADLVSSRHDFASQPIGSGRFRWLSGKEHVTLARVRDQQRIVFDVVKDPTVRALKLLRGEVDIVQGDMPPELVNYLASKPTIQYVSRQGSNFSYLGLNLQDNTLKSLAVRQALALGIDKAALIKHALVKNTRNATVILPPEHWAGHSALAPMAYQPQQAKALLQQAGFRLPVSLEYKTSTDPQRLRLATIIQAQLAEAGFAIQIKSLDWGTYFEDIKQGHFQLYGLTWVGIKTPEIYTQAFHHQAIPPQGFNRGRVNDAVLDQYLEQQDWIKASARIYDALYYIPLWYEGQFAATTKRISGYPLFADGNWDGLNDTVLKP